jgi:hypothetical protein
MSSQNVKKDTIASIRYYVDKIVSDPTIGGIPILEVVVFQFSMWLIIVSPYCFFLQA